MSTIQSDYPSNRRSIEDLEKDYETQSKKQKQASTLRENRMEQNYKEGLAKNTASTKETVEQIRDQFDRYQKSSADETKTLREDFAKQSYDRQGRMLSELREKDAATASALASADANTRKVEEAAKRFEVFSEERSNEREAANQKLLEKVQKNYQEEVRSNSSSGTEAKTAQLRDAQEQMKARADRAVEQAQNDTTLATQRGQKIVNDYEERMRTMRESYSKDADKRAERVQQTYEKRLTENAEAESKSRSRENASLRKQIKDFTAEKPDVEHSRAEARSKAIADVEGSTKYLLESQQATSEAEKRKLKKELRDQEGTLSERFDDALRDQGRKNTETIRKMNAEFNDALKRLKDEQDRTLKEYKGTNKDQKAHIEKSFEGQRDTLVKLHEKALRSQQETFQNALSENRKENDVRVKLLADQVRDLKTTQDPSKVSPGVENKLRADIEKKYSDSAKVESERNRLAADRVKEQFAERTRDIQLEKDRAIVKTKRDSMAEQMSITNTLTSQVEEAEYSKKEALNSAAEKHSQSMDQSQKNLARTINTQRLHYEDAMGARDAANEARVKETLQDVEFEKRQLRREFQTQMNLTVRGYEKKLAEQKDSYEEQLRIAKDKASFETRDTEKRSNQLLAEQAKTYERRIQEQENMHKQRDKLQEKIYEDELDKVKRSNALLLSKKS